MKLLLIAEESAGARVLKEIASMDHEIFAVLTTERLDDPEANPVWRVATKFGYDVWPACWVKDPRFGDQIGRAGVDLILNIHSLHLIVGAVLSAPRIGSFNLHPGPLPTYAGLNVPSWAIFRGEKKHAVTLHKMEPRVDAGDIVFQEWFDISEKDTGLSVAVRCIQLGIPLVTRLLAAADVDPGAIPYRPQNPAERRYFGRQAPYDGVIPWNMSAERVNNFIRASDYAPFPLPWGRPKTYYEGREIAVTKAALSGRAADAPPGSVVLNNGKCYAACSDEWLEVKRVYEGGQSMSAKDCLSPGGEFHHCSSLQRRQLS